MLKYKIQFAIVLMAVSSLWAESWHLEQGRNWKVLSAEVEDKYLLAVAEIKQLVNTGQSEAVRKALVKLKEDFPEIARPDFDAFIKAELLFCEGQFVRAVRGYDKFLSEYPESELYEAVLDRQFAIATAFLGGQKKPVLGVFKIKGYAEGARIMERISDRAGDAPIGVKSAVAVAKSFERRGKFTDGYHKWSQILSRWPTGEIGRDALLGMARCKHAAYKGPRYDASNLVSAKRFYENFKLRYPARAGEIDVDKRLKQIEEQLAHKQFSIGRYYEKTGNRQSANFYYQMVIDNWPDSTVAKMAKEKINQELKIKKQNDK